MTKHSHFENQVPTSVSFSKPTTKDASVLKSQKLAKKTAIIKKSGISLRNQLFLTVLPVVLTPLIISSIIVYKIQQQNSEAQIKPKLREQALLAGEAAKSLLEEELKLPAIVANNPLVIDAARRGSQQVEANNLQQIPIEQVEKSFSTTRLLQPNQDLNDYLRRTAKIGQVAQLFFTEKYGFNVAYTIPPYDFVQRDEQWWQEGKSKQRLVSAPDFDPSVRLFSINLVQAIADPQSGEFLGVVKSVVPASRFDRVASYLEQIKIKGSERVQLVDSSTGGVITTATADGASSTRRVKGSEAVVAVGASLVKALQDPKLNLEQAMNDLQKQYSLPNLTFNHFNPETEENEPSASFLYQDRFYTITTIPRLNWVAVASIDSSEIISTDSELIVVFALTALVLGIGSVVILLLLARQLSTPLVNLAKIFEQVRSGNLDVVAQPIGNLETQLLARSWNNLALKVKSLMQQQTNHDVLQQELLQLLSDVEGLSGGDLTVRANIGTAPVSTIAGFLNLIIESLRDIVTQVKQAAAKVNGSIAQNEGVTRQLADRVLQQTAQITKILNSVEDMNLSIQEVAEKAQVAVKIAHTASTTAETGGDSIGQTLENVYQLRSTAAVTVKKVKQLGEFSQEIVQAIAPINQIAMQTNVLAINANIEAARIEAKHLGLATVAEEVGVLAEQLAIVKTDIEQIVDNMQRKTSEVVKAMELEISQIVAGTSSVEKAQQEVEQIFGVSHQLEQLMQSIADDTLAQAQTSRSLTQLKEEMMLVAERTSDSSIAVSSAWQETLALARQLQISVEIFKIGDET